MKKVQDMYLDTFLENLIKKIHRFLTLTLKKLLLNFKSITRPKKKLKHFALMKKKPNFSLLKLEQPKMHLSLEHKTLLTRYL